MRTKTKKRTTDRAKPRKKSPEKIGEVFVVVLEDRHTDPMITVHQTIAGARARVEEHKKSYHGPWEWSEEKIPYGMRRDWLLYLRTDTEDGPSVRIQREALEP